MILTTAALIAALVAAAAAGIGGGFTANANRRQDVEKNALAEYLLGRSDANDKYDKDYIGLGTDEWSQRLRELDFEGSGLTAADAAYLADYYAGTPFNFFDPSTYGKRHHADLDALARDYDEYLKARDLIGERPADIDYEALASNANQAIDDENAQVLALYDQMLGRSNDLFQSEMDANNEAFGDYARQIQTNNAMGTQAIAGSTRYEMDRARRNAIQRGATAAQQLTANINAQLGLQNRAAQQQLETSNQLASALLQQRQAAAQLRGDYVSNLNADASRRAGLISGTTERKAGLRNSYYNEAEARHEAETEQWKDRMSGYLGDSPFSDVYNRSQSRGSSRKSTYGL